MRTESNRSILHTAMIGIMIAVVVSAAVSIAPAAAQTGPEILQQMIDRHQERLTGIDNILIEQEMMGFGSSLYLVKEMVDGTPTMVPRTMNVAGMNIPTDEAAFIEAWTGSARVFGQFAERFTLDGTQVIDGQRAYRLAIDDFTDIDFGVPPGQDLPMTPVSGRLYIDPSDFVLLRMEIEMNVMTDGGSEVVEMSSTLEDYREVDGYLHPFDISVDLGGLLNVGPFGANLEEVRAQLDQLEARLDQVPPAQRDFVERLIQPLRATLDGAPIEIVATRLSVNVDPPRGR